MDSLLPYINQTGALLLLILGFSFLIFIHEFGHFIVAKMVGVRVEQFAIGFGQAVLCYRKGIGIRVGSTEQAYHQKIEEGADPASLGETEYRLNWMPLGGYVKMLGQDDLDPSAMSQDPRSFNQKPVWARACVISAGVVMNALFAMVFFVIAFLNGVGFPPAQVGQVEPGSPADTTAAAEGADIVGLRAGDRIVKINGNDPSDFTNVRLAAALARANETIELTVRRPQLDGESKTLRFRIKPEKNPANDLLYIGISPPPSLQIPSKAEIPSGSSIMDRWTEQNLRPGMKMTAVNGQPVSEYWQFDHRLQAGNGKSIEVTFADDQGSQTITLEPRTNLHESRIPSPEDQDWLVSHLFGLVPAAKIGRIPGENPVKDKLKEGDIIASLNGSDWPTVPLVIHLVQNSDGPLSIAVLRDGERKQFEVTPRGTGLFGLGDKQLGIGLEWAVDAPIVAKVLKDSPFAELQWVPGTRIQQVAGRQIDSFTDLRLAVENADAAEAPKISYVLPTAGGLEETSPLPQPQQMASTARTLRWGADLPPLKQLRETQAAKTVGEAVVLGFQKTHLWMVNTYVTLTRLFQGTVKVKHLRGPVGIADMGTQIVLSRGVPYLIFFLGLISINLAVINFLPLPIVDGGLFVLLMIEKLRGKPVPPQIHSAINFLGLVLLAGLFLTVTYHDLARIFTGG